MPQETYSPAQAAKQAGIPLSTLRLWCGIYGEFLSSTANPGVGVNRRLTAQDVEVMRAIAQLRHNGVEQAQIIERLRTEPLETLQPPTTPPTTSTSRSDVPTGGNIQPASQNTPEAFLAVATSRLDDVARRTEAIDDRLKRVESSRNLVLIAVAAFAAGAVAVGVIAWLVSLIR